VVQGAHVEEAQDLFNPFRDPHARMTRGSDPGRVVVGQDDRSRVEVETAPRDFTRVHGCTVHGAVKQIVHCEESLLVVQKQAGKDLGRLVAVADCEIVGGLFGTTEGESMVIALSQSHLCGPDHLLGRERAAGRWTCRWPRTARSTEAFRDASGLCPG
jgi:hypothetical protein